MLVWLLSLVLWFIFAIVKFVLWFVGLFLFCLWWCQGELLYLPNPGDRKETDRGSAFNPPGSQSPAEHGLDFEDHHIPTPDGVRVHLWFIKQERVSTCPTILFFHGNASNIGFRLYNAKSMHERLQANIVMVEYRGFGESTGVPSEKGLMMDAQAALDWVRGRSDVDQHSIYLFGRSLGGAVAMSLCYANQDAFKGVILENTFLSIDEMVVVLATRMLEQVNVKFKYVSVARAFLTLYLTSHWKSDARAAHIRVPLMLISGLSDELIPPTHSAHLYKLASPNCPLTTLFTVEGGGHNDTHMQQPVSNYYTAFRNFLTNTQAFEPTAETSECELQRLNTGSS